MNDDQPTQPLTDACPTCSGPTRETTHMICLECGTDYAATPPRKLTDNALEVLRAGLAEVDRLRAELHEAHRTVSAEEGRAAALEAVYRQTCTERDVRSAEIERLRTESVRHIDCNAEAWAAAARVTRDLRAELDSMTQFAESLRAERDRSVRSCGELGVELDRLRADLSGVRTALINAHEAGMSLGQDVERLRNEATGTALGHLAKIERLQSERDALVRKLGLDWGPDEFGDLDVVPDRECTCHPTNPATWTTHGSAVEPGSMYEPDLDCPRHK